MEDKNSQLIEELAKLNKILTRLDKRSSPLASFLSGILAGLGSFVGATIVVGILIYILSQLNIVPIIGNWLSQIFTNAISNVQPSKLLFK